MGPRRSAFAMILRTLTSRSSPIVRTSPGPTAFAGVSIRTEFTRMRPSLNELRRQGPGFHNAGEPEPFVDPQA